MKLPGKINWLGGYPKSGSTWIRLFLDAYILGKPVDLTSNMHFARTDLEERWCKWYPEGTKITPRRDIRDRQPTIHVNLNHIEGIFLRPMIMLEALKEANRDIVMQTHHSQGECYGINILPPFLTRGAVYIVRDPRDIVPSWADHLDKSLDDAIKVLNDSNFVLCREGNEGFTHILSDWSTNVNSWLAQTQYPVTLVRYEEMLADPIPAFTAILQGLGLKEKINRERMVFALAQTNFSSLQKKEESLKEPYGNLSRKSTGGKFFRRGEAGAWREILSPLQVERIQQQHWKTMQRVGYKLEQWDTGKQRYVVCQ